MRIRVGVVVAQTDDVFFPLEEGKETYKKSVDDFERKSCLCLLSDEELAQRDYPSSGIYNIKFINIITLI